MTPAIDGWLRPLRTLLDPTADLDWRRLHELADGLDELLAVYPVGADLPPGPERSRRLLAIRRRLATRMDTASEPAPFQLLAQFVCGYRDLDLRDATGLGHGSLIARHGSKVTRRHWIPRLRAGDLAGIALTEPHGGSRTAVNRTRAVAGRDGTWRVSGRKAWISRLTEAAVFVVFFRSPHGHPAAAAIDATRAGLRRHLVTPSGLGGWAWGLLDLDAVPVHVDDVLAGDGTALVHEHFAGYRPLVAATALGAAAAVFDTVTTALANRVATGELPRLRDSALTTLGRAHPRLVGALLAARLAQVGHREAEPWAAAIKAHGVDTAHRLTTELAPLLGASGFRADCQAAKARRDLAGLLYADGIHDSLYLAAGKRHVASAAGQAIRRPCSHSAGTPCSEASSATAMRS